MVTIVKRQDALRITNEPIPDSLTTSSQSFAFFSTFCLVKLDDSLDGHRAFQHPPFAFFRLL